MLEQPCSTGGRTDTVRPKREPTGRTDLSDRSRLVLCNRSQELIGQACPTRRQVLRSDSACPTTGRTVPVRPPVEHGCLSTARTAVFDRLMPAVRRENEQAIKKQETILIKPKQPIKKATTRRNQEICVSELLVSPSLFPGSLPQSCQWSLISSSVRYACWSSEFISIFQNCISV